MKDDEVIIHEREKSIFRISVKSNMRKLLPAQANYGLFVALLGYLVDQYDLGLFAITRVSSLGSLGLTETKVLSDGIFLLNAQMIGMLVGGIFGGIVGDKYGRVRVLYWSMLLYALGNISNGFISSVPMYAVCRFISGVGLASEMGACITIIAETFKPTQRTYGMMLLIVLGHVGGIIASVVAPRLPWRMSYVLGGTFGMLLFILRLRIGESELYKKAKTSGASLGDLHRLLLHFKNFNKFIRGILSGLPVYFISGILLAFAPEIGKSLGIAGSISAAIYFPIYYVGIVLGDLSSGLLSQRLKSLKKVIILFQLIAICFGTLYFNASTLGVTWFYMAIGGLGYASGHWVLINTLAAEQFGTNVRASIATSTPNFIRVCTHLT